MPSFVHLHVHSEYSMKDSTIRIGDLVDAVANGGMEAAAITDQCNMIGAVQFYKASKIYGIKPIIGCELCVEYDPDSIFTGKHHEPERKICEFVHLILLCENQIGYKNLMKLATAAHLECGTKNPHVRIDHLRRHCEGLIALSCCLPGEYSSLAPSDGIKTARELAIRFAEVFGRANFYLELQGIDLPESPEANRALVKLGRGLGLPLVATNPVHYLVEEDIKAYQMLRRLKTRKSTSNRERLEVLSGGLHLKSPGQMLREFSHVPEAIENTLAIAERCKLEIEPDRSHFPAVSLGPGESLDDRFEKTVLDGFERRLEQMRAKRPGFREEHRNPYEERLQHEMAIIRENGFQAHFLVVGDYVNHARNQCIPVGAGSGAAPSSLVAYAMNITDIDPLEHGLHFERFINPLRPVVPDFFTIFSSKRRNEVLEYLLRKHGKERVAHVGTLARKSPSSVVRRVGKEMAMPPHEIHEVAKIARLTRPWQNLVSLVTSHFDLARLQEENPRLYDFVQIVMKLDGLVDQNTVYPLDVVIGDRLVLLIGDKPVVERTPLFRLKSSIPATQYPFHFAEEAGLVSYHLQWLRDLAIVDNTLQLIGRNQGVRLQLAELPLDDPRTYALLNIGDTNGVYQLEESRCRDYLIRLRPDSFADIVAFVSLYRPGPLEIGMMDDYIQRENGRKEFSYEIEALRTILEATHGMILFQEQVMRIAFELADYSLAEADVFRKDLIRKEPSTIFIQRKRFISGADRNGINPQKAERLFDRLESYARHLFIKDHVVAHSITTYHTAYLKANYRIEFMTVLLNCYSGNRDRLRRLVDECVQHGIKLLPPEDQGRMECTMVGDRIFLGSRALDRLQGLGLYRREANPKPDGVFSKLSTDSRHG